MRHLKANHNCIADPHGQFLALAVHNQHPETSGIFLETAHPAKFLEVVEHTSIQQ
ncbi:MAG: hypothetical protein U0T72_09030 [Chitinophagales bacterium]